MQYECHCWSMMVVAVLLQDFMVIKLVVTVNLL
jgi:hypothetical protein